MFDMNRTKVRCAAYRYASDSSTELPPARRLTHFLVVGFATLMLLACGGGGDSSSGSSTPLPTVAVTMGTSDTPTLPGSLASGSTTDDTTPKLMGSLSASLTTGQQVQVFDGDTLLAPTASVTGMQWQFTPLAPLAEGDHRLSAAVVGADGKVGPRSAVFALTIKETKVVITGAVSDTPTQPGSLSDGSSTDDATPTLSGSVNITLAAGQKLQVYDGDTPLSPEANVSGSTWQFTPSTGLLKGAHQLSAAIVGADGRSGQRSPAFALTVTVPGLQSVSPSQAVRATPTTLRFSGNAWPSGDLFVVPTDSEVGSCELPSNFSSASFDVACRFNKIGVHPIEIKLAGQTVGRAEVNVISNVSGVTWQSPSTNGFGQEPVRPGDLVTFKVSGTQLLDGSVLFIYFYDFYMCPGIKEIGTPTQTERVFSCQVSLSAPISNQRVNVFQASPGDFGSALVWEDADLPVGMAPKLKVTGSGITAKQCYQAGSDLLVPCDSAEAIALSGPGKQDGMRAISNPMSFSKLSSYDIGECVKDNITGLLWAGNTFKLISLSESHTNYDSTQETQTAFGKPTQAQIDAPTNSIGQVNHINKDIKLCGYSDWRRPTAQELFNLMDYGRISSNSLALDPTWFPNASNTVDAAFWSSSKPEGTYLPPNGEFEMAWLINFQTGQGGPQYRENRSRVVLVR